MPTSNVLRLGPVDLKWCKILDLHVDATNAPSEGEEIEITMDTKFRRVDEDGFPSGLEVSLSVKPNGGRYYSISLAARAMFAFPEGASCVDAENYLAEIAPSRVLDVLRTYIEQITGVCAFGAMTVPPLSPVIDVKEWHKEVS